MTSPLQGGCPILNFGVESDDTDPVVRKKVRIVILDALKSLADIVTEGIRNKEFSPDFDAEEFALKAFTLIEGSMMICRVLNSNKPMQKLVTMLKKEIDGYTLA